MTCKHTSLFSLAIAVSILVASLRIVPIAHSNEIEDQLRARCVTSASAMCEKILASDVATGNDGLLELDSLFATLDSAAIRQLEANRKSFDIVRALAWGRAEIAPDAASDLVEFIDIPNLPDDYDADSSDSIGSARPIVAYLKTVGIESTNNVIRDAICHRNYVLSEQQCVLLASVIVENFDRDDRLIAAAIRRAASKSSDVGSIANGTSLQQAIENNLAQRPRNDSPLLREVGSIVDDRLKNLQVKPVTSHLVGDGVPVGKEVQSLAQAIVEGSAIGKDGDLGVLYLIARHIERTLESKIADSELLDNSMHQHAEGTKRVILFLSKVRNARARDLLVSCIGETIELHDPNHRRPLVHIEVNELCARYGDDIVAPIVARIAARPDMSDTDIHKYASVLFCAVGSSDEDRAFLQLYIAHLARSREIPSLVRLRKIVGSHRE